MSQSTSITPILLPLVLVLVFAALRRFVPAPASREPDPATLSREEIASYGRYELAAFPLFFACAAATGYAWYWALRGAGALLVAARGEAVHVLGAEPAYWALPAIFLGIVSSAVPIDLAYRRLLRDRYERFMRYGEQKHGYDTRKVMRAMSWLVGCGALVFVVCGVNGVTRVTEDGLVVGRAFSLGAVFHPYASVRAIALEEWATAPNGNRVHRPHYIVRFDDGTEWRSDFGLRGAATAEDRAAIAYIASRTGIALAEP
jgi:hypothetical protein